MIRIAWNRPLHPLIAWLAALVSCFVLGCGTPAGGMRAPFPGPLPAPASLRRAAYTPAGLLKQGCEYGAAMPSNRVAPSGDWASFTPDWTGGVTPESGLAYAVYEFALDGYDREEFIRFSWAGAGAAGDGYVGLANWDRNRWDWYLIPPPMDSVSQLDVPFADYLDAGGKMLVAPLMTGRIEWLLVSLQVGTTPLPSGWLHTWGSTGGDTPGGAAADSLGNLYICGTTQVNGAGQYDLALLKYSPQGELLWQKTWGTGNFESGDGIALGESGDIYLLGGWYLPDPRAGLTVLHLSPAAELIWQKNYEIPGWISYPDDIDVDPAGCVYASGQVNITEIIDGQSYSQPDIFALKLNGTGELAWDGVWSGLFCDYPAGIAADGSGGCFAGGWTYPLSAPSEIKAALLRFSPEGVIDLARLWGNGLGVYSRGLDRAPDGTLWISGFANSSSYWHGLLISCTAAGALAGASYLEMEGSLSLAGILLAGGGGLVAYGTTNYGQAQSTLNDALVVALADGSVASAYCWGAPDRDESFLGGGLDPLGAPLLAGLGSHPGAGSWTPPAVRCLEAGDGNWEVLTPGLKDTHGLLSEAALAASDVTGTPDADTGETENFLACRP